MAAEFRVNSYQSEWQDDPEVMGFADGSFVIMWRSYYFDTSSYYVAAQRYDKYGVPVGGEQVIDYVAGSASEVSNITRLQDGGFVVTFEYSPGGLLEPNQVWATIYNADFSVRTEAFQVDAIADFQSINANAAALADGGFVVFFDSDAARPTSDDIYGQRYDRFGNAIGGNFLVNSTVNDFDQNIAEVAQLRSGNVLVMWHSEGTVDDGSFDGQNEFRGTLYSTTGNVIKNDFHIGLAQGGIGDGIDPFAVDDLNNGGFAIVRYETEITPDNDFTYDVKLKLYDSLGEATSGEITVHAATNGIIYNVDVTQLATGEIVVVWNSPEVGTDPYQDARARIFDANGKPLTGPFTVSSHDGFGVEDARVEALAGGGFVVTFMSEWVDSDDEGIGARIFGRGTGGNDVLQVDASGSMAGLEGNDRLSGNGADNRLYGGTGADRLTGRDGNDTLWGGAGADRFIFNAALNAQSNVDSLKDFGRGADTIYLSQAIFAALGISVAESEFRLGTRALDADDHLIYNQATGALVYDANGNAAGGQVRFATLVDGTALTFEDFLMF